MGWLIRHAAGARVALSAPAEAGKANAALIKLLAKRWRMPQHALEVVSGEGARRKVLHVHGSPGELIARLRAIEADRNDDPDDA
jgi:uncharacterized protein YggU (UPF0235/DUF167 family)